MTFIPATVSWRDDDPFNDDYGDRYFSAANGLAESECVFLQANRIGERLRTETQLVIGELGFGTGLNFLATLACHRRDNSRTRLTFISTEAHPLSIGDLQRAHAAFPQFADSAKQLRDQFPAGTRGFHVLTFPPEPERSRPSVGPVTLLLLLGDAAESLAQLEATIDAWYLDGFSPATNPAMWSPEIFAQVARLSRPGTTLGTWTAAGFVRRGLTAVGFDIHRRPGHGNKRHRTVGEFTAVANLRAPGGAHETPPWDRWPPPPQPGTAAVIGAGLAGTAVAAALAARGIAVTVYDAADQPAAAASGNPAGLVLPPLQTQPNPVSDWQLTAYFLALRNLRNSPHATTIPVQLGGRRAISRQSADSALAANGLPPDFLAWQDDLATCTGLAVNPAAWCRDRLAGFPMHLGQTVNPAKLDADVVIDCRGHLVEAPGLRPVRGQLVTLTGPPPDRAYAGNAYFVPTPTGAVLGATFQPDDRNLDYCQTDEQSLLAEFAADFGEAPLRGLQPTGGRVAIRACSRDYLPHVGPLPEPDYWRSTYAAALRHGRPHHQLPAPQFLPQRYLVTGLGSHGIAGSLLAAELLAAHLTNAPLPIPTNLRRAVSPSRFLTRELRKPSP